MGAAMRTGRRRRAFTLVELLVAMTVFGAIGAITVAAVINATDTAIRGTDRSQALVDVQRGLERIGREVRSARPLLLDQSGDYATALGAVVYRDGDRIEYFWRVVENPDGTRDLTQDQVVYSPANATTPTRTHTSLFVLKVDNSATEPLFTYYAADGSTITCTDTTPSCQSQYLAAKQVEVSFRIEQRRAEPVVGSARFNVRNTQLN